MQVLFDICDFCGAGVIPIACSVPALCGQADHLADDLVHSCLTSNRTAAHAPMNQHLFTVYVHAPPDFGGYELSSPFYHSMVETRNFTKWGDHSTATVVKSMIREALMNSLNEKFMLLSETCIPLYPPQVILVLMHLLSTVGCSGRYKAASFTVVSDLLLVQFRNQTSDTGLQVIHMQLIQERQSRINACDKEGWERNFGRYCLLSLTCKVVCGTAAALLIVAELHPSLTLDDCRFWPGMESEVLKPHHWRKHWQWFALSRQHAELVDNDTAVESSFSEHCAFAMDETINEWRTCFSGTGTWSSSCLALMHNAVRISDNCVLLQMSITSVLSWLSMVLIRRLIVTAL